MSNQFFTELVALKYPFDIKNIKAFYANSFSPFSSKKIPTFDVTLFNAVRYETSVVIKNLKKNNPELQDYEHEVYAKYSTSKLPEGFTKVNKLVFKTKANHAKETLTVNIELHYNEDFEGISPDGEVNIQPKRTSRRIQNLVQSEPCVLTSEDVIDLDLDDTCVQEPSSPVDQPKPKYRNNELSKEMLEDYGDNEFENDRKRDIEEAVKRSLLANIGKPLQQPIPGSRTIFTNITGRL